MRIGIADTTFSRINMGQIAINAIITENQKVKIERYTVPGFKDLPVAAKILIQKFKCDIVIALGWVGSSKIDELCAHEANLGLIQVEVLTNTHILKVFVHAKESWRNNKLLMLAKDRIEKHSLNALALLTGKEALTPAAGQGLRQGSAHRGPL